MTVRTYFSWMLALFVASFLVLPTSKMVNNFYYIFIAIPGLYLLLRNYKLLKPINKTELVFLTLCFYIALYSFFEFPRVITQTLYVVLFIYTVSRFVDVEFFNSKTFARVIFWGGIIYAASGAVSYYIIGDTPFGVPVNPGLSRLDNPIQTSMFIACSLFVIGPHWLKDNNLGEGISGFVIAFIAIALVFQSRSGLAGMVLWSIFILICMVKELGGKGLIFLGIGLLILIIVCIPLFDLAGMSNQLIERADSNRFAIWQGYFLALSDCGFIIGCGFPDINSPHLLIDPNRNGDIYHPHNIYVEMVFNYGLILLLLFMFMMVNALYMAWRQRNWWGGYLFSGLLVLNFDGSRIADSPNEVWLMMWLPFALILAKEWQSKRETINKTVNWSGTPIVDAN